MPVRKDDDVPAKTAPDHPLMAAAGGAAVGLFAGMILGAVLGAVAVSRTDDRAWFGRMFLGAALAGALFGGLFVEAAFALLEGIVHFLFGFFSTRLDDEVAESPHAPSWLRAVFVAGAVCGVIAWLWIFAG